MKAKRGSVVEKGSGLASLDNEAEEQYRQKIEQLEEDLNRRQESYIRRERAYRTRVEELENDLQKAKAGRSDWLQGDSQMNAIRTMHAKILSNVERVQERTGKILQEQERDLLRAFRARLFDVQTELEKEKNKTDDGASAWIEKSRQLEAEVDWAKEMADRLDRVNQSMGRENARLKAQFKTQEDDREFLIRQLVAVKKDNARLVQEYEKVRSQLQEVQEAQKNAQDKKAQLLSSTTSTIGQGRVIPNNNNMEADNRYKEIIKRLKRLLEVERKNLRQVKMQYHSDMQQRTELEVFLRQCIGDVKKEIAARRHEGLMLQDSGGFKGHMDNNFIQEEDIGLGDMQAADRERVMELLLSQERVINLLYSKAFPVNNGGNAITRIGDLTPTDATKDVTSSLAFSAL